MRKETETSRVNMEMRDPLWETYKTEGPSLEEILATKPAYKGKALWLKDKGWVISEENKV